MTYHGVAKTLHWMVVCLLVLQFPLGWTMPRVTPGRPPEDLVRFHFSIGLTILAVMLLRLAWRLVHRPPPLPGDLPKWQRLASRVVHAALYAALLAAPVAGWAWASAKGWTILLFGAVAVPRLVAVGSSLEPLAATAHRFLGWAILALVGVHILAVLYHAAVRRDGIAQRMLPQ
jgi:cytochrome b561